MKKSKKLLVVLLALAIVTSVIMLVVSASGTASAAETLTSDEKEAIVEASLVMKVNSGNSLKRGVKTALSGAPYKENGVVYVPLDAVKSYTGKNPTSGYTSVTKGGVTYIAMNDVEAYFDGYYVTYDEVGLIFIATYDEFLDRDHDELLMHETAKRFIYTDIDFREITNLDGKNIIDVSTSSPISNVDTYIDRFDFSDLESMILANVADSNGKLQHPFILADQAKFDSLNATYLASEGDDAYDAELSWYIQTQIEYADSYLNKYANLDENGNYVSLKTGKWSYNNQGMASWVTTDEEGAHSVSQMPYTENYSSSSDTGYGYDPAGGRLNVLSDGEGCLVAALEPAALAYQITRDMKYLEFAYEWMYALCQWDHWGPGHYLNCANTSRPLATAYDWLYNGFVSEYGQDAVDYLAERIYTNGVYEGTVTLTGNQPEHKRTSGDSSRYWKHVGNWNSCGTLGMLIASLAIMDYEEYQQDALYVISASLGHYMERGMTYITFDGGYRESAGYWGCVRFMHFITKILMDTTGTDFGLLDFPGIDITDYFGCQLEGSNFNRWNYHDDWAGTQPSYWYYLSADLFDNPEYASIRYSQIHTGHKNKAPFRYDVLFYDKATVDSIKNQEVELALDYIMTGIDALVTRSSWDSNSLYAGIMGGRNNVAHGQYDSGNWIYENGGIRWFVDLGADDYNLAGGGLARGYYKYSAEGNNTLALESLPHGQRINPNMDTNGAEPIDGGNLIASETSQYGSYAILDQSGAYNGQYKEFDGTTNKTMGTVDSKLVEYAYRGMLFTNNRRTVVIQDEVKTVNNTKETFWWFAHYDSKTVLDVEISDDGRTVYMLGVNSNNEVQKLRVSLVSDNADLKFEIMDTFTYVLDTPNGTDSKYASMWSQNEEKGTVEGKRDQYMKLAVKAENVTGLNMAVVIELIGQGDTPPELGYDKLVPMANWTIADGSDINIPDTANLTYSVFYNDGTRKDYYTSKLSEGILLDPTVEKPIIDPEIERIECYGIVVLDVSADMYNSDELTINLNGHTLLQNTVLRVGNNSSGKAPGKLTVNGGGGRWVDSRGVGFQCRFNTTLIVNDLEMESVGYIVRDEGAKIAFNNCDLKAVTHLIRGIVQDTKVVGIPEEHYVVFNNCNISVDGQLFLHETAVSTGRTQDIDIVLMGNTSLTFDGGKCSSDAVFVFAVNKDETAGNVDEYAYIPGTYDLYIGDGVKLVTAGLTLPESGTYTSFDGLDYNITYNVYYRHSMSFEDGVLNLGKEYYTGEETVTYAPLGTDHATYEIAASGDTAFPYVVKKNGTKYFNVYYTDGTVYEYYISDVAAALISKDITKVVLLADSTVATNVDLDKSQELTIDLNTYTLTATKRIALGTHVTSPIGCKLVITNGDYVKNVTGEGFLCRLGTQLIFDGVDISLSLGRLAWDNGGALIAFNDCNVTSGSALLYGRFGNTFTGEEGAKHELVFNNSNVNIATSFIEYGEMEDMVEYLNVFVTGDSVLDFDSIYTISASHPATLASATYNVYVEEGAKLPTSFTLPEDTETEQYNLFGCQNPEFDAYYRVSSFAPFESMQIITDGNYYTVKMVAFVKGVKSSLTLYSDFTINFYLPVTDNIIDLVQAYGIDYPINENTETYTEGGVTYYKVALKNIPANRAADDISIVFVSNGLKEYKTFSVIKYCEILFANPAFYESYELVASAVNYINESYEYSKYEKPLKLTNMLASPIYRAFLPEEKLALESETDAGNISVAISTAQLDLGASVNYRFNLNPNFTGALVVGGASYEVIDGKCGELDYITVSLRAYDLYDPAKCVVISGTAADGTEFYGTYDLAAYIDFYGGTANDLDQLLSALYTYCTEAYENKYGVEVERPDLGDSPDASVDF